MDFISNAEIVRARRRTLALIITMDARLVIRAPLRLPMVEIQRFVAKKDKWIRRKMLQMAERPKHKPKQFIDGEEFFYLGNGYPLSIVGDGARELSLDGAFRLASSKQSRARDLFTAWYRARAQDEIKVRLDRYSSLSGLIYERFKITSAHSKWGSCSGRANLCFSWRLVMTPPHVIDYVVVHELAHITHKNHSRAFWHTVDGIFPSYGESEKWLKDNSYLFTF